MLLLCKNANYSKGTEEEVVALALEVHYET